MTFVDANKVDIDPVNQVYVARQGSVINDTMGHYVVYEGVDKVTVGQSPINVGVMNRTTSAICCQSLLAPCRTMFNA